MSSKKTMKKQTSLLKYLGFTKTIVHNNQRFNVSSDFVPDVGGLYKCPSCKSSSKTKQALASHCMWKHETTNVAKSESTMKIARHLEGKREREQEIELSKDVEFVMENLLKSVVAGERSESDVDFAINIDLVDTPAQRKEAKKRNSYDHKFKMDVIEQVDAGALPTNVAFYNNIDDSMVCRWVQDRKIIADMAANKHRALLKKNRRARKHDKVFNKLYPVFLDARTKVKKVSYSWLYTKASKISKELNPDAPRLAKSAMCNIKLQHQIATDPKEEKK